MLDRVLTAISRYNMLASGDRVAVAVSGGPDSVCLLHVLLELAPRLGVTVAAVAHLNHKLRGEASEEDERFVAEMASRAGVPFLCERVKVADAAGNLEQEARRARHGFFSRLVKDGIADRVATGHTADDQAETVLFRLLRGSGLAGLSGILPTTREGIIRPLLEVSRADVTELLRSRGLAWREDATNQDARFARNRIRHNLLPQLAREWNPKVSESLAHLADLAREEEQWWQQEISRLAQGLLIPMQGGIEIDASRLAALPKAVARRLVRLACPISPEFDTVERILDLAAQPEGRGKLELPRLVVIRSFDWLRFTPPGRMPRPEPIHPKVPGRYPWPGGDAQVCFEICFDMGEGDRAKTGCASLKLSEGRVPAPLELRSWSAGDHYRPAGHSRDQKIKELFQEARIPSWRRQFWPIVASESKILWVRGFGVAAECAAEDQPGSVLRIWEENA
jgi:tRNA(Ile)-lysidine synthase